MYLGPFWTILFPLNIMMCSSHARSRKKFISLKHTSKLLVRQYGILSRVDFFPNMDWVNPSFHPIPCGIKSQNPINQCLFVYAIWITSQNPNNYVCSFIPYGLNSKLKYQQKPIKSTTFKHKTCHFSKI